MIYSEGKIMMKNKLDEMQEQKLLKIEHNGVWLAFWGLFAAIIIQIVLGDENSFRDIIAESIVLLCLCLYMLIACIKNGIWDRKLSPNLKTNVVASLLAGLVSGSAIFVMNYMNMHVLWAAFAAAVCVFISTGMITLLLLSLCVALYKSRKKKLEEDES